ncbi:MAG: PilZ domain-containing protein [Candidatus Aminicenantes bacterium]|nr:PilZ domain-containing protein [Candidatus Aminicenantes bacterium]
MSENNNIGERRVHPRIGKQVYLRPSSVFGQSSMVEDISLGGLRIQSQKEYSIGETLLVQMSLEDSEWAEANLRVVWINEKKQDALSQFDIGCEFVNLPFDMQNELWLLLDKDSSSH